VPSREGAGVIVIDELAETAYWCEMKLKTIDRLTRDLASEMSSETPRIDQIQAIRRRLETVKNWNVLQFVRETKR